MRVAICAVGRLRSGPEAALIDDYLGRFDRVGRPVGLGPARVIEVEGRSPGEEAALIARAVPKGAETVALDERGRMLSSPDLARHLETLAVRGAREIAFLIGGADGLTPDLRNGAGLTLSFGPMVWPHLLVRVMLAEQLYRAAAILAGSPYHRGG